MWQIPGRASVLGVISECLLCSVPSNQSEPLDPRSLSSPEVSISVGAGPWKQESPSNWGLQEDANTPCMHSVFLLITNHRNSWRETSGSPTQKHLKEDAKSNFYDFFLFPESVIITQTSHQPHSWHMTHSGPSLPEGKALSTESSAQNQGTQPCWALQEPAPCRLWARYHTFCPEATEQG